MKIVVGIPARLGSSRFPGKPLCKILGMPMIEHVYKRCSLADGVQDIFVAACDLEVKQVVEGFGGKVVMTKPDIDRPGLRVAEACKQINLSDDDIVVVAQGDEPLVHPEMISKAVEPLLEDPSIQVGTLVAEANEEEWLDPNEVKVIANINSEILLMTRSPVPSNSRGRNGLRLKQVAVMPFRKKFLVEFDDMPMMEHERTESIELLRAVEAGVKVKAIKTAFSNVSVDTEPDRVEAEAAMENDEIFQFYRGG